MSTARPPGPGSRGWCASSGSAAGHRRATPPGRRAAGPSSRRGGIRRHPSFSRHNRGSRAASHRPRPQSTCADPACTDSGRVRHGRPGKQGRPGTPASTSVPSGQTRHPSAAERQPGLQHHQALGTGQAAAHPHEPAGRERPAGPGPLGAGGIGAFERDRQLGAAHVERHDDPGARRGLLQPGPGQVADADGGDDAVVGRVLRVASGAVRASHRDVGEPGAGQVLRAPSRPARGRCRRWSPGRTAPTMWLISAAL